MRDGEVLDRGPFFHGTRAVLGVGDVLEPLHWSNYQERRSNYVYFTATLDAAKWGAELAVNGDVERIYVVEPVGGFEDDPNVTNKRFAGNPTRSYRSKSGLRIVAVLGEWERHSAEQIGQMKASLERLREQGLDVMVD